jgi:hypothetical protein
MGEIALRKIQAGLETTRGTVAGAPTRNIYGVMTISREQARRFATEDRGTFVKNFRANPKLIQAGFRLESDVTFEDFPYFLETVMQGGITPTGASATGFLWTYNPDLTSDLLKTRTYYAGDDTVQWRGAFGASDTLDITLDLDEAVKMELGGFVQDWVPVTSAFLATPYTGGFAALADRTVESMMGYQSKLFVDPVANPMGTTRRAGKFISARWGVHLNNKKKNFGDNLNYALQKLGRGEKDIACEFVFEGLDQQEFADHYNNTEALVRIQLIGTPIAGTTFGVTATAAITTGAVFNGPIQTGALTSAIPGGVAISVGGQTFTVTPAGAASAATSIPIIPQLIQTPANIPIGSTIMAAKTINLDMWGYWDTFVPGARETNTTWGMKLVGVYDATAGFDHRITVVNQNNLAAGIT